MPPTDAETAAAIAAHHTEMRAELNRRIANLVATVRDGAPHREAARGVLTYLEDDLLPHAMAEEATLYPAGSVGATVLLVRAMSAEHEGLVARVAAFRAEQDPLGLAAGAVAIGALFESHLAKENDLLIPALVANPDVVLAELLAGMHELIG